MVSYEEGKPTDEGDASRTASKACRAADKSNAADMIRGEELPAEAGAASSLDEGRGGDITNDEDESPLTG